MGIMRNSGYDGSVAYKAKVGKWQLEGFGNFTYAKNRIVEMDEPAPRYPWLSTTGLSYSQLRGLTAIGLFRDQEEIDKSPRQQFGVVKPGDIKYADLNDDGVINSYDVSPIGGTYTPRMMYGFGFRAEYNGIHVEASFQGSGESSFMMGGRAIVPFQGGIIAGNLLEAQTNRWTEADPRQDVEWPRLSIAVPEDNNYQPSTWWLRSGNYLRLKDVQIGYSFRPKVLSLLNLRTLYIYVAANNVVNFTRFKLWDPELGSANGAAYPLMRTVNFGLKTNF